MKSDTGISNEGWALTIFWWGAKTGLVKGGALAAPVNVFV